MNHRPAWMALALGLLLCAGGCGSRAPRASIPTPTPLAIPVARVQRRTVARELRLPADVEAWQQAMIYARVAGYLDQVLVDKGDRVRAGQLLARIRWPEMEKEAASARAASAQDQARESATRAQVPRALAEGEAARADFERARALEAQAQSGVSVARAAAAQAQAEVKLARTTYERLKGVYDIDAGLLARQDLDEARTRLEVARDKAVSARQEVAAARQAEAAAGAAMRAARFRLEAQNRQMAVVRADTRSSGFKYEASQQDALRAADLLSYSQIRAPFAGLITERWLDPGALVQNAASSAQNRTRPILALASFDRVRVMTRVPELEAPLVHRGTAVEIRSEALPDRVFHAWVTRTAGVLDESTRTMLAEADLPNPDHALRPGMYVSMTLQIQAHRGVLAVPTVAVLVEKRRHSVFIIDRGRIRKVSVETGFQNAKWVEIRSGLKDGEEIAGGSVGALVDGAPVRPLRRSR